MDLIRTLRGTDTQALAGQASAPSPSLGCGGQCVQTEDELPSVCPQTRRAEQGGEVSTLQDVEHQLL